jgi:hypothetical protein
MTTMITEIYEALREAGASEEKAKSAAEAVATYQERFGRIERRLGILTWQVGTLTAVVAALGIPALWMLARVAAKVGAIG